MTTTIFLVRHGQTDSNIKDIYMGWSAEELNNTGFNQVQQLASRLARQPIAAVYTSPLQRTMTTSRMLSKPHRLSPVIVQDLIEINLGNWEGLHISEIKQKWPEQFNIWRSDPSNITIPGGESLNSVTERSTQALQQIAAVNKDKNIIVVTHEIVIKVIVPFVLNSTNSIYRRFVVDNASLSIITVKNDNYRLKTLNDTAHYE